MGEFLVSDLPGRLGYRMPAEWEKHEATWLSWPTNKQTWPENIEQVEECFIRMTQHIGKGEKVRILTDDADERKRIRKILDRASGCADAELIICPTEDVWIRDYGPNFIVGENRAKSFNRWHFDAWGKKYDDLMRDDEVQKRLVENGNLPYIHFSPDVVLEGGSIDVNGRGICLTTRQCLLDHSRNPGISEESLENILKGYLGVHTVVWLGDGIAGDDTDGHVDDITRFTGVSTVVTAYEENRNDANFSCLHENFETLKNINETGNLNLDIVRIPMPDPVLHDGVRLPASYANFYIANSCVLVPVFGCAQDKEATDIISRLFPGRQVVGIDCRVMVRGLGTLHCASQQEPAVS